MFDEMNDAILQGLVAEAGFQCATFENYHEWSDHSTVSAITRLRNCSRVPTSLLTNKDIAALCRLTDLPHFTGSGTPA